MRHEKQTFTGQRIVLDGNEYDGCTFEGCQMVYTGGDLPVLANNRIGNCSWHFEGSAGRSIEFMCALYSGGGHEIIENTLQQIRGKAPSGATLN